MRRKGKQIYLLKKKFCEKQNDKRRRVNLLDTHCHINDPLLNKETDKIVTNYLNAGVEKVICIGCCPESNLDVIKLANKYESVYCAVGVHPDDCYKYNAEELENLLKNKNEKVIAVGEIGLDYYHTKENRQEQIKVFESQIQLANKYKLPIVIHCRDAFGDTLEILKKYAPFKYGAVMHCYSGSLEFAREIIKLGLKISFTGTVTYKNALKVQEVAKNIPLNSFFFETDCPYLTPTPYRGQRNEPMYVKEIYKFVADLRDLSVEEMEEIADSNAKNFFKF